MVGLYEVVKSEQLTQWNWALDNYIEALKSSNETIRLVNELLKAKDSLSKDEIATIQWISKDIIATHTQLKSQKPLDYQTKIQWLGSRLSDDIYPPLQYPLKNYNSKPLRAVPNNPDPELHLSDRQRLQFSHWQSISSQSWDPNDPALSTLHQDHLQDCSFVTSFITLISNDNATLLLDQLSPHTQSAKHSVVLHFNGARRIVEITDKLPILNDPSTSLFAKSKTDPALLWPALIEKAYLKVQGNGYDSKGSNAGIDTFMISGWIPQYVTSEDRVNLQWWDEIKGKLLRNELVLSLGTGAKSQLYSKNHDYAIVGFEGEELFLKNPWGEGNDSVENLRLDISNVFRYFETVYVNWNPSRLLCSHFHFIWSHRNKDVEFYQYPQFRIHNNDDKEQEVLVLSEKHLGFKDSNINALLYDTEHGEILFTKGKLLNNAFSKANNTRFHYSQFIMKARSSATLVLINDATEIQNFTIRTYSSGKLALSKSKHKYKNINKVDGEWTTETSGGNWSLQSYINNPQYVITVPPYNQESLKSQFYLSSKDNLINFQLFYKDSKPLNSKNMRSSLIQSKYQTNNLYSPVTLTPGITYVLVPSTYDPSITSPFSLVVNSEHPLEIARQTSRLGLYVTPFTLKWRDSMRLKYKFKVPYQSKISIHLWSTTNEINAITTITSYRPQIRASLFYAETQEPILINTEFDDDLFGIWLQDVLISETDLSVVLLIERFEMGTGMVQGEIGSDFRIQQIE